MVRNFLAYVSCIGYWAQERAGGRKDKVEKVYVEYAESKIHYGHNFDAKFDFSVIITDCSESQWRDMDIAPILDEMQAVLNSHYSK